MVNNRFGPTLSRDNSLGRNKNGWSLRGNDCRDSNFNCDAS
jgi:hypothetical protein